MDDMWKALIGVLTLVLGWLATGVQKNIAKHDSHTTRLSEHDRKLAVSDEQQKNTLAKMDAIIDKMEELKKSNHTVLRALARRVRKDL